MNTAADVPQHIAIVMDGNGRWAEQRGRPRTLGHQAGLKALRKIVEHCGKLKIHQLTIFAFSSENWNRPKNEVNRLMDLFMRALDKEARELNENGVRLNFIGDLSAFAPPLQESIQEAMQQSQHNHRMALNVAVNYGGRWDIVQACQTLCREVARGERDAESIDEAVFSNHVMLAGKPEPDLFIRTGGEIRISNFLLWQSAYTEFYFSEKLWPDFSPECLDAAIADYASRERRFGKTGQQVKRKTG